MIALPLAIFLIIKYKSSLFKNHQEVESIYRQESILGMLTLRALKLRDLLFNFKLVVYMLICVPLVLVPGQFWKIKDFSPSSPLVIEDDTERIMINIPSATLSFKGVDYMISPGKPALQTPVGTGYVSELRKQIKFVYTVGWRKGQMIEYAHTLDGRPFRMPYQDMRGIAMNIKGYQDYVIHSTTEDWAIGRPASSGCIRMRIGDILKLFDEVKENTPVVIDYILVELKGSVLVFYQDVYKLKNCIIDGKYIDTFEYAHYLVSKETGREISFSKYSQQTESLDFTKGARSIAIRDLIGE